jgi:hypothetical protein
MILTLRQLRNLGVALANTQSRQSRIHFMKKLLFVCAFLTMLCQSSFAMSPLFANPNGVPDASSTMGLLAVGLTGLAIVARKLKK